MKAQIRQTSADQLAREQEFLRTFYGELIDCMKFLREPIAQIFEAMRLEDFTSDRCDLIEPILQAMRLIVSASITVLSGPVVSAETRPYPLIMHLRLSTQNILGTVTLVRNVRGQCRWNNFANDPTGSYWHLRASLQDVVRDYHCLLALLALLRQGQNDDLRSYFSATA